MTERWPLGGSALRDRMAAAVADPIVPGRIRAAVDRFGDHRLTGLAELHDADGLRHQARALKASILADLPALVDRLTERAEAHGVIVHRAGDAEGACRIVAGIAGGKRVVKSKSMATEEIGLDAALDAAGARVVETDLGEWIVQLAGQTPSHIIAPAVHHDRHSILEVFERVAGAHGVAAEPTALNAFARERLRAEFLAAEVGITGVNFAVADTGSLVLVTNEGNGRLVTSLPPVHVAVMGMERLVRSWAELDLFLTLLTRSATGQRLTSYTSVLTGPRRPGEPDGPDELHLVIVDHGRTALLGGEHEEMLSCLRCGACLNVCPVYRQTGGHAYGWVYPGPMGAVLTPLLLRETPLGQLAAHAAELPGASTLCGACMDACPVEIPLQDLLLHLRQERAEHRSTTAERRAWRAWSTAWSSPTRYRTSAWAARLGRSVAAKRIVQLPGAGEWSEGRAVPMPADEAFRTRWSERAGRPGLVAARPGAEPRVPAGPRPPLEPTDRGHAHPRPAPSDLVPPIRFTNVDATDLVGTFARSAAEAGARVHVVDDPVIPADLLARLVAEHEITSVVATAERPAFHAAAELSKLGGLTMSYPGGSTLAQREQADLGVTGAIAAIAATGSVVVDTSLAGDRTTSLLPRVHLVVIRARQIVATPAGVWHRYGAAPADLPSNLVVITGPSRTGDIEQLLTVGVHGPHAVEIIVMRAPTTEG